ncbi:2'-5' RNA ligase family protein [Microbacterium sp. A94]|uniref:2'-5' RNA ligase family protein n=1 Tax=Microbacterium sp. A94 TaxID=3450717 RepID=UPI003F4249F4
MPRTALIIEAPASATLAALRQKLAVDAWLAPESPAPFIELTAAVTHVFPAYPPYGGLHDAPVPHATVGDSAGYEELQEAERAIAAELPLSGTASAVVLLVEGSHGRWHEARRFPLSLGKDK